MYSVELIASYFIYKANEKEIDKWLTEWISHLKLQKVLYFAQVTFLCIKWKSLFKEKILAWKYWPVVEEIYNIYSRSRKKWNTPLLKKDATMIDFEKISSLDAELLDKIWDEFGKYSAMELVDITHAHKPWKETPSWDIITKETLKDYYKPLILSI